jgi:hypothetical protein
MYKFQAIQINTSSSIYELFLRYTEVILLSKDIKPFQEVSKRFQLFISIIIHIPHQVLSTTIGTITEAQDDIAAQFFSLNSKADAQS